MTSVYIETSVISYLTARPSRDIVIAGHQQITHEWWEKQSAKFELFVSELVIQEAIRGDPKAVQERLKILESIEALTVTPKALQLAQFLLEQFALPAKAEADALHISISVTNGIDYLLTWNCKHIANAITRRKIEMFCYQQNYEPSVICTPEELMEV